MVYFEWLLETPRPFLFLGWRYRRSRRNPSQNPTKSQKTVQKTLGKWLYLSGYILAHFGGHKIETVGFMRHFQRSLSRRSWLLSFGFFSAGAPSNKSRLSAKAERGLGTSGRSPRERGTSEASGERLPKRPWKVDAHPFEIWSNMWFWHNDICQKEKSCTWSNRSSVKIKTKHSTASDVDVTEIE